MALGEDSFSIVPVSKKRAADVLRFRIELYDEAVPTIRYTMRKDPPVLDEVVRDMRMGSKRPVALLAIVGDRVVGEAWASRDEINGELFLDIAYAVAKSYRGTGVIYALLYALVCELGKKGVGSAYVLMSDSNTISAGLIEKLGGRRDSEFSTEFYTDRWMKYHKGIRYSIELSEMKSRLYAVLKERGIDTGYARAGEFA